MEFKISVILNFYNGKKKFQNRLKENAYDYKKR